LFEGPAFFGVCQPAKIQWHQEAKGNRKTEATATYTSSLYTTPLPLDSYSSNWRKYSGL